MAEITLNGAASVDDFSVVPSAPYPITDFDPILDLYSGHGFIDGYDAYVIGGDAQGEPVIDVVGYDVVFPGYPGFPGPDQTISYSLDVTHNGVTLKFDPPQPYVIPFNFFAPEDLPVIDRSGNDSIVNAASTQALLAGLGGNDTLIAGSGGDTLDGGTGADSMVGGAGNDTFYVDNPKDVVVSSPGQGEDTVYVSNPWKLAADDHIAHVILTGAANLAFTANAFTTSIAGNDGVNTLDDGGYAVALAGGANADVYIVRNAGTQVSEAVGGGYDTVQTALHNYTLPDNVEALTYVGALTYPAGSLFVFTGTGNAGTNVITGSAGNDRLDDGGGGSDRLVGGNGDDVYYVHSSSDYIVETSTGGNDTIYSDAAVLKVSPYVENVIHLGSAAWTVYGNDTGVTFLGGAENDRFIGGAGDDAFKGSGGNDTFTGGAGADTFYFDDNAVGVERITDFQVGVDTLVNAFSSSSEAFFGYHLTGDPLNTLSPATLAGLSPTTAYTEDEYDRSTGTLYADDVHIDFSTGHYTLTHNHVIATFDNHPALTIADL